jgi:hypothetical protein
MGGFRRRLRALEETEMLVIPQRDVPPAKFPRSAYVEAFMCCMARLRGGPDIPQRHPLLDAARNSSDPAWRNSYFADIDLGDEDVIEPPEDLSEGQGSANGGGGGLG